MGVNNIHRLMKLFLFACVLLPSGSMGELNLNVKMIILILIVLSILMLSAVTDDWKCVFSMAGYTAWVVVFLLSCFLYSYVSGYVSDYAVDQAKYMLLFFAIPILFHNAVPEEDRYDVVCNVVIKALVFVSLAKMLIVAYSVYSGISISDMLIAISYYFGTRPLTGDIEDSLVGRVAFASDIILPYAVFIATLSCVHNKGRVYNCIWLLILLMSVFMGMSRFYWAATLCCIILAFINDLNRKKSILFLLIFFVIATVVLNVIPETGEMIRDRFSEKNVSYSDGIRKEQFPYIFSAFERKPLFGNGIGFYLPEYMRAIEVPYLYELQILSLLMQFGIVGFSIIFIPIFISIVHRVRNVDLSYRIAVLVMAGIWFASGFFNPVLFSSSGGVAFLMIFTMPDLVRHTVSGGPKRRAIR